MRCHRVLLALLVATSLILVAAPPPSTAQANRLTVLCTPQEDWCVEMTRAFQAKTGIQTSFVRLSSGEAFARVRASRGNPDFSVWWGGPVDAYIGAASENFFDSYVSPVAAELAPTYIGENNLWYGIYVGATGFCSNVRGLRELGLEPPTSWQDLLDPRLKGQVAIAHPATSGTAFTAFWTVVTLEADKLEFPDGKPAGHTGPVSGGGRGYDAQGNPTSAAVDNAFTYFKQLHQNVLQYTRSGLAPGQMAGRGEIATSVIFSHDCVKYQVEGFGDILRTTFPSEGTGYEIGGVALLRGGPEPEAARRFVDFALSAEGQATALTVNAFQLPTHPQAPVSPLAVNLASLNLVNYNFVAAGNSRRAITERFDREVAPQPTN